MALMTSVSGIRGTIGGAPGHGLTPLDIVSYTAAYGRWLLQHFNKPRVVIGRDARTSGPMMAQLVSGTLIGQGIDVVDIGLSTTPTVELAVKEEGHGGIILTASHNPFEWNALKLLNNEGEFLSKLHGEEVMRMADRNHYHFAGAHDLGQRYYHEHYLSWHVEKVCELPAVNKASIEKANFKVVVDGVNSTGGVVVPQLLSALGVQNIQTINGKADGQFAHNPEPLSENLEGLKEAVKTNQADLGIAVDPDVDRLAFVSEDGTYFGEEYTLVAMADHVLSKQPGGVVANLSTTQALMDVVHQHGGEFYASPVGEVHVVERMKEVGAILGGEGNGGVIEPALHYGRDALVGIAYMLSLLAQRQVKTSELRQKYPTYHMTKAKVEVGNSTKPAEVLNRLKDQYRANPQDTQDGLKLWFQDRSWVHLRESNTEPVIRIYAESPDKAYADKSVEELKQAIENQL